MISALVIVKDQEELIEGCIKSLSWVNEVVVVDTGSHDHTIERAKAFGARVYAYQGEGNFSAWRNFGLTKVRGEWLLVVDSDERVLEPLRVEIEGIINSETRLAAWQISRRNIVLGKEVRYGAFWPDYVVRLFKVDKLKGWNGLVHEQPVFDGKLESLNNSFLHLTHRDIDSMVQKSLAWAEYDAHLRLAAHHPKMSGWRFLRIFITELWNQGVLRRGFFGGTEGVIDSLLQVFSFYISYVKLWQLQQRPSLDDKYKRIDEELEKNNFRYTS